MIHRVPVFGLLLTLTLAVLANPHANAQTYTDIHDFNTATLTAPESPGILAQGRDGNLYGTAPTGGTFGFGGVFRITPAGVYTVIYNFDGTMHGKGPRGGLTLGADGKLLRHDWSRREF